jgi:hypothetical protein
VRVWRDEKEAWSATLLTGEDNMCHSIANLEHHLFKYSLFRRPGDVHIHFFGASVLSSQEGFKVRVGDIFEVECDVFGKSLCNPLALAERRRLHFGEDDISPPDWADRAHKSTVRTAC